MTAIYSLCATPESAQEAFDALCDYGILPKAITVLSAQPFEHHAFGRRDPETRMPLVATLGGLTGFLLTIVLISLIQLSWPLNTGGMPIVSVMANLIPIFEMTMLFAILSTVLYFLVSAGLPDRRPDFYDPAVSDGKIFVGVRTPAEEQLGDLERILAPHGEVKRIS